MLLAIACAKDPDYKRTSGTGGSTGSAGTGGAPPPVDSGLPTSFKWTSPGPLITARKKLAK